MPKLFIVLLKINSSRVAPPAIQKVSCSMVSTPLPTTIFLSVPISPKQPEPEPPAILVTVSGI